MTATYTAKQGASLFDICLQTYSDLNKMYKLITDNAIDNIDAYGFAGKSFLYDTLLISDNSIVNKNINTPYVTEPFRNSPSVPATVIGDDNMGIIGDDSGGMIAPD